MTILSMKNKSLFLDYGYSVSLRFSHLPYLLCYLIKVGRWLIFFSFVCTYILFKTNETWKHNINIVRKINILYNGYLQIVQQFYGKN